MAREQFFYAETTGLLKTLDEAARRAGVSRGKAFEDFLHFTTCCLSGGLMEEQYMKLVPQYSEGRKGRRAIDSIAELFGKAISAMEETRDEVKDVLGDLYAGGITYGEAGQYYTPQAITDLMADLTTNDGQDDEAEKRRSVCDPCCGSGRMLMSVARHHPHWQFVGQDVDLRCVRLCAINMGLRNMYGYVVWGDSLKLEQKLVYRTGFNINGGVIREVPIESCPAPVQQFVNETAEDGDAPTTTDKAEQNEAESSGESSPVDATTQQTRERTNQLELF
ncbi:MAG: SAM-dependent DNA methyltransferase [Rhodopirellula sp.]|nr:SAM-dependent DNA methyltransferase [Rhodopirellula sp.]